jgi:hypothetical protein
MWSLALGDAGMIKVRLGELFSAKQFYVRGLEVLLPSFCNLIIHVL